MNKIVTFSALILLAASIVVVASCSREVVGPADDSGTDYASAAVGDANVAQDDDGTRTPGYWKKHEESWPVGALTLGGVEYSKQRCIEMLSKPARGDHSVILCRALIAAKLNVVNGCEDACVANEISAADVWFAQYGLVGSKANLVPLSTRGRPLADVLDDYNNGLLCAPASTD